MKTLFITFGGTVTPGDLVMVSYTHPQRGGNSTLQYRVQPPRDEIVTDPATGAKSVQTTSDTIANVIAQLLNQLNQGQAWPPDEFHGSVKGEDTLVITVSNALSDCVFSAQVEGAGTETVKLEDL